MSVTRVTIHRRHRVLQSNSMPLPFAHTITLVIDKKIEHNSLWQSIYSNLESIYKLYKVSEARQIMFYISSVIWPPGERKTHRMLDCFVAERHILLCLKIWWFDCKLLGIDGSLNRIEEVRRANSKYIEWQRHTSGLLYKEKVFVGRPL